jgi:hypothetical protein
MCLLATLFDCVRACESVREGERERERLGALIPCLLGHLVGCLHACLLACVRVQEKRGWGRLRPASGCFMSDALS